MTDNKQEVEIKTADLIGPALDWATAKAACVQMFDCNRDWPGNYAVTEATCVNPAVIVSLEGRLYFEASGRSVPWSPSTDWAQGGPLIDKHITALNQSGTETYWAHCEDHLGLGPTALVAACRAIVAAKRGDTVMIPGQLAA